MKKTPTFLVLSSTFLLLLSSCVSMKEYEKLQSQYNQATKSHNVTKQELQELREENAELVRQNQNMTTTLNDLAAEQQKCKETVTTLNRAVASLQLHYDTTVENYMQQLTGKNRDLSKTTQLLEQRTRELNEKEEAFRTREQQLQERQNQLEAQEEATRAALAAKEKELENVRNAVTKALVGFSDMGLNVEAKEGKVYVSMEDKLLFASGSWTVSAKGVEAIKMLAQVLEENKDLNIMVEGHTDNDAYHGSTAVKDNWDLSVMRATAIVKLLLKQGPAIDPARVEACGHGEYAPRVPNTSAANKAANRRTEIILTPKLSDLMNLIEQ
ncbi:MAG: OmpA family protein [Bacteroidales bacterium]|nr:OmpA family protein [Bacteroidales bacterium]